MPEVAVLAEPMPSSGVLETPAGGERDAVSGRFLDGHEKLGGRRIGAKNAAKCLDRAAPKLARHMILRSFKSDSVLCKTMDKILPDAGRVDTLISVSLSRDDVLTELRRRGITAPLE